MRSQNTHPWFFGFVKFFVNATNQNLQTTTKYALKSCVILVGILRHQKYVPRHIFWIFASTDLSAFFVDGQHPSTLETRPPPPHSMLGFMRIAGQDRICKKRVAFVQFSVNTFRDTFLGDFSFHLTANCLELFNFTFFFSTLIGGRGRTRLLCENRFFCDNASVNCRRVPRGRQLNFVLQLFFNFKMFCR